MCLRTAATLYLLVRVLGEEALEDRAELLWLNSFSCGNPQADFRRVYMLDRLPCFPRVQVNAVRAR